MRLRAWAVIAGALVALGGCGLGPRVLLVVELQSDLIPSLEFTSVRTTVGDERATLDTLPASFTTPSRVAELRAAPGTSDVRVELLDRDGSVVAERRMIVDLHRDTGVVVFISARCRGVVCAGNQTCIGGTCRRADAICGGQPCTPGVGETCTGRECDDAEGFCPAGVCDDDCATDDDCPDFDACSIPRCASRVCVGVPIVGACPDGLFCSIAVGCVPLPPGTEIDGGVRADGSVPLDAGPDGGGPTELCQDCITLCRTPGREVCVGGEPTGECVPPSEICDGRDQDCDGRVDESVECGHDHAIVCELGVRVLPDMTTEANVVDNVTGGGPGRVCAADVCQSTLTDCETLPGGSDAHVHPVELGGAAALTIEDDVPFSVSATVGTASGHSHGATCGLGATGSDVEAGLAFHRIAPTGADDEARPAGRYDQFCRPPVGDPSTECYPRFGFCTTD